MESEASCHAEASIELRLEPQAAWDVVMDWERQSRWMLLTRVWATEQGGAGVGGGVAARTSVGALGFTDDMVITHWDPPRECTVKHLGKLVRGTGTFTITPSSTTTPGVRRDLWIHLGTPAGPAGARLRGLRMLCRRWGGSGCLAGVWCGRLLR